MAVKKQPESSAGELSEAANHWFQDFFLRHLDDFLTQTGSALPADSDAVAYRVAAMRAVKLTLLESGMDHVEILELFGQVALEDANAPGKREWNAELNKRRFDLIDRDIQGTLSRPEEIELAGLTQLMREHIDSEANLPLAGARKLHRSLSRFDAESPDLGQ